MNYCENNPGTCENGGKCTSLIKSDGYFSCECPTAFRGDRCNLLPLNMSTMGTPISNKVTIISPMSAPLSSSSPVTPEKPVLSARTTTSTTEAYHSPDELEYEADGESEDVIENET